MTGIDAATIRTKLRSAQKCVDSRCARPNPECFFTRMMFDSYWNMSYNQSAKILVYAAGYVHQLTGSNIEHLAKLAASLVEDWYDAEEQRHFKMVSLDRRANGMYKQISRQAKELYLTCLVLAHRALGTPESDLNAFELYYLARLDNPTYHHVCQHFVHQALTESYMM